MDFIGQVDVGQHRRNRIVRYKKFDKQKTRYIIYRLELQELYFHVSDSTQYLTDVLV